MDSALSRLTDTIRDVAGQREDRLGRLRGDISALANLLETTHAGDQEAFSTSEARQSSQSNSGRAVGDNSIAGPTVERRQPDDTDERYLKEPSPSSRLTEKDRDEPVDRVSLADNLFGSGETELALRVYSEIGSVAVSVSDRLWVRYQLACCHRRLGNSSEAESTYREIANSPDAPALAASARWWLDTIQRRKRLEQRQQQLQQQLIVWEDYVNERTKP
jgi:hypothetical protein